MFIEGANKLLIESKSASTIEALDTVLITDTYLIGFKKQGPSGLPVVTVYSFVKYISDAVSNEDVFEISPQELKLLSNINLEPGMTLVQADLMEKALFLYFRLISSSVLFRICTTTYKMSQINFNGEANHFPLVTDVQYLEYMGVITISYRQLVDKKEIFTIRSAASVNTLEGMTQKDASSLSLFFSSHGHGYVSKRQLFAVTMAPRRNCADMRAQQKCFERQQHLLPSERHKQLGV